MHVLKQLCKKTKNFKNVEISEIIIVSYVKWITRYIITRVDCSYNLQYLVPTTYSGGIYTT